MIIKLNEDRIREINSILIILTLYIGILTYPIINITGINLILWVCLGIILIISIFLNKTINIKFIFIINPFIIFFVINYFSVDYKSLVLKEFINFCRCGILMLYLASQTISYKYLIKWWYKISIVSIIICNLLLIYFIENNLYMDFGIFMTYNFIIICTYLYKDYNKKMIFNLVLTLLCLIEILIFGNRGSGLICILIVIGYEISNFSKTKPHKIILKLNTMVLGSAFILLNIDKILKTVTDVLNRIGIHSYFLNKIVLSLQNGFISESSGRDKLLYMSLDISKNSGFMPKGVRYLEYITEGSYTYTHNIFTDILLTFGIIGFLLFCIFIFYITYKIFIYRKYDKDFKYVVSNIYMCVAIRLTLSSTFWQESLFWMLIGSVIFYKCKNSKCIFNYTENKGEVL